MKKILIALGVLVTLVVAAVLVVPSFIDWSEYRVQIAQKVKEATGRDLLIGGDIAFSLVPDPVLRVSDIRLANAVGASSQDMVAIRQLDVRVALLPLLGGTVHVNSIRMIEPVIHLEVLPDGAGNWVLGTAKTSSENIETSPQAGDPVFEEQGQQAQDVALPVQIDDFIIERGEVVYSDPASGIEEKVSDVNSRFGIAALNGPFEAAGTMVVRGIPVGFEGSVGQIVHGRTATFASEVRFAHGATTSRITGTFVNLNEGPKVNGKISIQGKSLAGLITAIEKSDSLPGGLDRDFSLSGDVSFGPNGLSFGKDGLGLSLGEDRGTLSVDFAMTEKKTLNAVAKFSKIDGDAWLSKEPYTYVEPQALPLVIKPSKAISGGSGKKVSAALSAPELKSEPKTAAADVAPSLPKDIDAKVSLAVEALILKGEPVRQLQGSVSLANGELALERLSAILPGAGEMSLIGVAGEREGKLQFDGSLELDVAHLRGALRWFDVDVGNVPTDRLQQIGMTTQIQATPDEIRLIDLVAKLDASTLTGASTIALRSRPSFGASFNLDRLNVDAYMGASNVAQQKKETIPTSNDAAVETAKTKTETSATQPAFVDALGVLDKFDANIALSLGHLTYQKRDIKNVKFDGTVYDGGLNIRNASVGDFAGLKLGASGAVVRKENGIVAENLNLKASGKSLVGAAEVVGIKDVMDWKKFGSVALSTTFNGNLLAPDFDVNADVLGGSVIVAGTADILPMPKAEATVNLQFADIRTATKRLGLGYQPSANPGALELNSDVIFDLSATSLNNINGQIGKAAVSGKATFKQGARPFVDVMLQTGTLRLDPFMPKQAQAAQRAKVANRSSGAQSSSTSSAVSASGKWSKEQIDLSALKSIDAKIRLNAEGLSQDKITLRNVVVNADLKDGVLDVSQVSAGVFGGQAKLTSKIIAQEKANITSEFSGTGLDVARVLSQTGSKTAAGGGVDFSGQLATQGQSEFDFVSNLNGVMNMDLKKISVGKKGKGGSPLDILNLLAALSGTNPSKGLADVTVKSDITNGVAKLTTAALTSNIANGGASGQVDLLNWLVDVSGNLSVKQNALVGLLAQKAKIKQEYPFSITGILDKPNVKLDSGGVSSGGGLVIPLSGHAEKKGYGNLIRGLLGAGGIKVEAPEEQAPANQQPSAADGALAPPPPPPGGSNSNTSNQQPSVEEQLLKGLGNLLKR